MSQRCPFLSHKRTQGRRFPSRQTEKATKQSTQIFILYLNSRSNLGQTMEKWVKSCENQAKYGQKICPLDFECVCRQWLDLTARVLMGSCVQSGGWDHPVYTQYIVYYIPRSRHGAASHISQTSGFLHLLTSGQQPDTSSTPSAFTGVHKCWWRRLISKYQHVVAWDQHQQRQPSVFRRLHKYKVYTEWGGRAGHGCGHRRYQKQ